jgi:hypothetical protein
MKKTVLIISMVLSCFIAFSQNTEYAKSFDWMVKTFEENDAGFQNVVDLKGTDDYTRHTALYREKILKAKSKDEYFSILNSWLFYFRKGHIGVFPNENSNKNNTSSIITEGSKDSIRALYKNEVIINLKQKEFEIYLQKNKDKIHPIEGIWKNISGNNYVIGIIRSKKSVNHFDAFIIKADSIYWTPKQKKAEFTLLEDLTFDVGFSMRNHQKKMITAKWVGTSHAIISMMNDLWIKTRPNEIISLKDSLFLGFKFNKQPFIKKLNSKTVYFRITSFDYSHKPLIDGLLSQNDSLIKTTHNLIIDIRNGTGGSDLSYSNLIPLAYTNPIRYIGMKYRATELNAQCFDNYAMLFKDDTATNRYCTKVAKKMRNNIGKFIDMNNVGVSIDSSYTALEYPAKVAIICNKYNGSTDEAFLYHMRQSLKVKIFGRPSGGMIDFSNMNYVDFPNDSTSRLGYTMTASKRLPDYVIDGVGIQPDYFIDDSIKEEDWIEFVQSVIEK